MKKVTIIVPVYNCEKYLKDCFNSIENQTFGIENLEVIIINDGSTDNSGKIIQTYCNKHKDWIYIEQENKGLSFARNLGVEKSTTEYISFLDSDDYLAEGAMEILYNKITTEDVDLAIGKTRAFDSKKEYKYYTDKILSKNRKTSYSKDKKIIEIISAWGKVYKKSAIKNTKFIIGVKHEDIYFSLNLFLNNCSCYLINEVVLYRRYREEEENKSIMQNLNYDTFHNDLLKNYRQVIQDCSIDFYFEKVLIEKLNKYIMKNLRKEDTEKAFLDCKELLRNINNMSYFQKKILTLYNRIWNILARSYINFIRR